MPIPRWLSALMRALASERVFTDQEKTVHRPPRETL